MCDNIGHQGQLRVPQYQMLVSVRTNFLISIFSFFEKVFIIDSSTRYIHICSYLLILIIQMIQPKYLPLLINAIWAATVPPNLDPDKIMWVGAGDMVLILWVTPLSQSRASLLNCDPGADLTHWDDRMSDDAIIISYLTRHSSTQKPDLTQVRTVFTLKLWPHILPMLTTNFPET